MAIAAAVGLLGAVTWLLSARRPVVDLFVLSNRDFAVGSMMMSVMAIILYSSAVLIPQLSQEVLGYDATHAGLVLSPGGFAIVLLIPLVGRLMKRVQTRLLVATGFTIMGLAFIYSSRVSPDVSFGTLVTMRAAQAAGLAFLFVPISTAAYATMPRDAQGDATALFTLFRNLFGSIGISISTALVTSRTQVHSAYLARYDTVLHAPFGILQAEYTRALEALGYTAAAAQRLALGRLYQVLRTQAAVSSYTDVFMFAQRWPLPPCRWPFYSRPPRAAEAQRSEPTDAERARDVCVRDSSRADGWMCIGPLLPAAPDAAAAFLGRREAVRRHCCRRRTRARGLRRPG